MVEREESTEGSSPSDEELFAVVRMDRSPEGAPPPEALRALGTLFERHHRRVLAQCRRLLGDAMLAEDATHEIFLSLLRGGGRYEARRGFGAWLYVVTRNRCLNVLRDRGRVDSVEPWADLLHGDEDGEHSTPDQDLRDLTGRVERVCADRLSPMEQRVVRLRFEWGMTVKQIDALLELSNASGARTHLSTATRKIREALGVNVPERNEKGGRT